ncbi:MAG: hypothetical protein EAZ53_14685 [Bacteroidetes bacterium]|nr:MAG: hypothetical protein EAZ53_14685 [Bacteroidota bacterium]
MQRYKSFVGEMNTNKGKKHEICYKNIANYRIKFSRFVGEEHQPLGLHHCIKLRSKTINIIINIFFFASFFF